MPTKTGPAAPDMDSGHLQLHPLPEPTLTLSLPSIHDNTSLDCRVYHPLSLNPSPRAPPWDRHVAVVAHPYSPLGGCQDDRVVSVAASTLLRLGFLVATFNFRGAGGSPGRTSWTGKAERADYMSVAGFLVYYSHHLDPFHREPPSPAPGAPTSPGPVFLFAGYSYGGNIVTQLPSLDTILACFDTPVSGSPAAEIRMRAQHTAEMQNTVLASARAARSKPPGSGERSPRKSLGLRIGGDEENRKSHDSRRSFSFDPDEIRKGVADIMHKTTRKASHHHKTHPRGRTEEAASQKDTPAQEEAHLTTLPNLTRHRPSYLLISPPQGMFRNLLNLSFANPFSSRKLRRASSQPLSMPPAEEAPTPGPPDSHGHEIGALAEAEQKLVLNTTFTIYGDQDLFVPLKRTREWAASLKGIPGSRFRAHEVSQADHFWVEGRVLYVLADALEAYGSSLLRGSDPEGASGP